MRGIETIDCHAHLGGRNQGVICDDVLLSELERAGVSLALVSSIGEGEQDRKDPPWEAPVVNRSAAHAVRRHPDRLRALLWAQPGVSTPHELEGFLDGRLTLEEASGWTDRIFVGIELHPDPETCPADDERMDPFMELARGHELPVVLHRDHALDDGFFLGVQALASRHPSLPIVLYHAGTAAGRCRGPGVDVVASALGSGTADLYLETSQAPVETVLDALRCVGPGRVLFGTDAVCFGAGHYEHYRALGAALAGTLDGGDLTHVMARNARDLFRLTGASAA